MQILLPSACLDSCYSGAIRGIIMELDLHMALYFTIKMGIVLLDLMLK